MSAKVAKSLREARVAIEKANKNIGALRSHSSQWLDPTTRDKWLNDALIDLTLAVTKLADCVAVLGVSKGKK